MHFLEWSYMNSDLYFKFVAKLQINNIPILVQTMARHRPGDNDGTFIDAYTNANIPIKRYDSKW